MLTKDYIKIDYSLQSYLYFLDCSQNRINNFLQQIVEHFLSTPDELFIATKYSLLNGGKRLRPTLVYAVGDYFEVKDLTVLNAAAASLELIHCYSLVHDDLPAMDDANLRRGKKSCHKAFSEATAILVGDGLQALAFQILADPIFNRVDDMVKCNMILQLAKASGLLGMVNGQAQDLANENQEISLENLEILHSYKTGALIKCAIELAILVSVNDNKLDNSIVKQQLLNYGHHLGLMFQIKDDILDFEQPTEILGKPGNLDQKLNKATFVTLLGLAGAKQQLEQHYNSAIVALQNLSKHDNKNITLLQQFVDYCKNRDF